MRVSFVIISVSDRVHELNHLLETIRADRRWDEFDINIMFQDPAGVAGLINLDAHGRHLPPGQTDWIVKDGARHVRLIVKPEKLGCHGARVLLLREIRYDAYVNLDDDMELGPQTNYMPAIQKALEPGVGFVITAWARTPALLAKKEPAETFRKQILVYNGGGMAYGDAVADLMRELPPVKTAFDCAWPITAYVNGYVNLYYYGSLTVHRVCIKGGMQTFMKETPLHVMGAQWLRFHGASRQDGSCLSVLIPLDKDVKPEAKEQHRFYRMQRFGLKP